MDFPRRDVELDFDPAAVPARWYGGDAFVSAMFDGLSLLFPRGETFFVESVRRFRDQLDDPALRRAVAGFAGQEAMHGKGHRAFNDLLSHREPALVAHLDAELAWILDQARRLLSPESQLAATCALEHFTAILAEQLLALDLHQAAIHPTVRPLWMWHALEETEHKAVAFDVYRAVGGGELRRAAIMLLATVIFFAEVINTQSRLMAAAGTLRSPRIWWRGLRWQWGRPGLLRRLIPRYLSYFRPSFHPSERDTDALVTATRERLFGAAGVLRDRVREVWPGGDTVTARAG